MAMTQSHYRRRQILAVAAGVASVLLALIGDATKHPWLARAGAAGFLIALFTIIALGCLAWRRQG
jgi:hypothetical protein